MNARRLNVTRLEDGWFLHRLVMWFSEEGVIEEQNFKVYTDGNRRDIEMLCRIVMLRVSTHSPKRVNMCAKSKVAKRV